MVVCLNNLFFLLLTATALFFTNRASTVGGITNQTFAYTANDWLTTDIYDANGNTRTNGANVFHYDPENRLTNAIIGGVGITVVYDGDSNRVRKIVGTTTNTYLVDRQNPTGYAQVLEERVNGNLSKVYAYGLDLISQSTLNPQPSTVFFGYDGLGSTRLLTTTNASAANVFAYDAFGTLIANNAATQRKPRVRRSSSARLLRVVASSSTTATAMGGCSFRATETAGVMFWTSSVGRT